MVLENAKSKLNEHFEKRIKPYMPSQTDSLAKRILAWGIFWGTLLLLIFLIVFTAAISVFSFGLPDVRNFDKLAGIQSTLILDREGEILYTIHGEENRKYVPLSEISEYLQKATIAIEDDQFYDHIGFDLPGIAKGLLHELFGIGARRGGSTITQQLSKNAFLTPERTYIRKTRELILAVRLERAYEKNKILELYLNRIPYGNNAYGTELASQIYFEKQAKDLNIAEAAVLAALPKAPTYYSPYGEHARSSLNHEFTAEEIKDRGIRSIKDLKESEYTLGLIGQEIQLSNDRTINLPGRVDFVLNRMTDLNFITSKERDETVEETRRIIFKSYRANIRAPHFVFYIRRLLEEKYGKDAVESGGLRVYTTIDPKYQELAEDLVAQQAQQNTRQFNGKNAAFMAADAKTGEIIAMVGSADYFNQDIDGNVNIATSYRQPGSSFKPFMYAQAFLNGYNPATVLYDVRTHFGGGYIPNNFDGEFHGPVNIRRALGQSRNIPAIKTYFLAGQEDSIIELAEKMGVTGIGERKPVGGYGPSLGIGTAEARMTDLLKGYMVLANTGRKKDFTAILRVEDRNGKILEEFDPQKVRSEEVLDPQAAYLINHILSDTSVNFGRLMSVEGHTVAAKTGTSNKKLPNDLTVANNMWMFAYTPQVVVGAWAGNSDNSPLKGEASGYYGAGPITHGFISEYLKEKPAEPFPKPQGIKEFVVSKASGKLPNPSTPEHQKITELFAGFGIPTEYEDIFVETEVTAIDGLLPNENTPARYREKKRFMNHKDPIDTYPTWHAGIKEWADLMAQADSNFLTLPPTEITPLFTAEDLASEPKVFIESPAANTTVPLGKLPVTIDYEAPHGFRKLQIFLDGHEKFKSELPTKNGHVFLTKVDKDGIHLLTVRVTDRKGYFGEASIEIRISRDG